MRGYFCFFSVQLFLNICDFRYLNDTPQFSVFHMFSCYMYFHATHGNCFALLTVILILCQCLFYICLNRGRRVVQEQNPLHLSGISCCVVHFSCFLVTQNNLQTFSALCWTLNWYSTPIKLSTVARTCYWVMAVMLQHTILCIYYGVLHFRCIILPLAQSNLAYHFIIQSLNITRFSC